ncbi:MAG: 3-dehydroquinate synthase family protein [Planctomycetota bacterium]
MSGAPTRRVRVELGERSYDVVIGDGVASDVGALCERALGRSAARVFLVADDGVPGELVERVRAGFGAGRVQLASAVASEREKSMPVATALLERLASTGQTRAEPVVAVGGGIVGDVAGYVAASYRRGVPFVQCPTTLLAMVDASVGGKTGVNLVARLEDGSALLKNMAGAFHQPALVVADVAALASLRERDFRSGLAECVKHGVIARSAREDDPDRLGWLEDHADRLLNREPRVLADLVEWNVRIKASVVAGDEREMGGDGGSGRALLNMGHTFAHAIETLGGLSWNDASGAVHQDLRHGEAVAVGLIAAAEAAAAEGRGDRTLGERLRTLLARLGLPTGVHGLPDLASLIERMRHDKKSLDGGLRLVLPEPGGRASVVSGVEPAVARAGLAAIGQA